MLLLMTIEGIILHFFSTPRHSSMYIFLIPLSYFIFNFIIFYSKGENKVLRKYSSWIYILHPLFIVVARVISKIVHINILINNSLINYIFVLVLTISFIIIINKGKDIFKNGLRIKNK